MKHRGVGKDGRALGGVLRSRYWRTEDARRVLRVWQRSGETLAGFARRQGVSRARLARWRDRLEGQSKGSPAFHPVRVVEAKGARDEADGIGPEALELIVRGGRRVVVRRGFDGELLEELVRAVEGWRC